ncbi:RidA family protein [Roseinatronobacter bogoriensis]|uniref:RidA family protein n=1 Tax=Roseinatronobacter bogoriensis subsp. barguzinensis TaxID=441209 RepID=A0A2K8K9F0_9RHOB|nr:MULTISPECIES: RidA family protein [Rhodobaca]ATX64513.1 RidA family protein [Rhodobaca barguzinensis]MBB4209228.1 enamine deaminase RidA (YjgF/YER057c/UK114 family) [Rhodobaca bogoriensis DSM 18756]TDW36246.1 enamine deaminase RidA (YjgF/YER057c/UK114 family) [Rhodobaca barguzinensis]TDY67626.1 enamine deaminase RidA (YjgF/YER057c/UK114 family) [Rhodobaca bogoriensis DSM 18756]
MLERHQITSLDGARKAQIVASEDLIFMSGMQPDTTDGDIREQMRAALKNVDAALATMNEDQSSIFVIHIWLKDMRYFSAMNAVWNEWADSENPPARTCVSGELFRPDLLVELVVTACRTKGAAA